MKIQILNDLHVEINRLFVAGSRFAKGDPRISKYIPALNKMGEKAPVMKKLAEKVELLVNADQKDSMEALAEAGTFLYAILATQGSISIDISNDAKASQLITFDYESNRIENKFPKTSLPYSMLHPIIEALTKSKQGRLEIIEEAYHAKHLEDFRLYEYLVDALADRYTELAIYLQKTVIPSIGSVMIPYLLEKYDKKGGKADMRRLALLDELGYEDAEKLAFEVLEDAESEYMTDAVFVIGNHRNNEKFLLTLTKDRKAAIREAAFISLVKLGSKEGIELLMQVVKSPKFHQVVEPAKLCTDIKSVETILSAVESYYEKLLDNTLEEKEFRKKEEEFMKVFPALENKNQDTVYRFYKRILEKEEYFKLAKKYHTYYRDSMVHQIANNLKQFGTKKELEFYETVCTLENAKRHLELAKRYYEFSENFYDLQKRYEVFSGFYVKGILNSQDLLGVTYYGAEWREGSAVRKLHKDWYALFEKKKDIIGISVQLNEDNASTKEGMAVKELLVSIIKDNKKKGTDLQSRAVINKIFSLSSEEEQKEIKAQLGLK